MGTTEAPTASADASVGNVDLKLEVQIIPASNVDRAKEFYKRVGFRIDADDSPLPGLRIVQTTPPGSGTSVNFGTGITTAAPGSSEAGLIVSDIEAAHHELAGRGIDVSDIRHGPPFPVEARQPGVDPERTSYASFFSFTDPDGNTWLVQEVTTRAPGRMNATDLATYPRRTWRVRFRVPRLPTPSTRSAPSATAACSIGILRSETRTGPPGTRRTWWPSRPGRTRVRDRSCARPGRRGCGGRHAAVIADP